MLLFQLKGLVLGNGTLFSLWKLPSCSIGMDISNPGEEQLPMQKSGRSGMFLTLQASSTWSADTRKPTKQSRVHLNKWWCFLRKLLEPSRTFFLANLYYRAILAFWSTRWCTHSGAVLKCTGPKEAHVTCVTQDATPAALQKTREDLHKRALLFMSFQLCSPALYYKSSSGGSFCQLQKQSF